MVQMRIAQNEFYINLNLKINRKAGIKLFYSTLFYWQNARVKFKIWKKNLTRSKNMALIWTFHHFPLKK